MKKYLQSVEKNSCQPKIVYPAKLSSKKESEITSFTHKRKRGRKGGRDKAREGRKWRLR